MHYRASHLCEVDHNQEALLIPMGRGSIDGSDGNCLDNREWSRRREDGILSISLSHPSVAWALKDIFCPKGNSCVCEQGMDIFFLFLYLVVPPFGSTWVKISKLKYDTSKNKLFSKNNNVGLLWSWMVSGLACLAGWTWPLAWQWVSCISWLYSVPQPRSVHFVLADHSTNVCLQKKSSQKVQPD